MEFAISQPKWSNCHETKSKHINWISGLKCDHQVWPWSWFLPLNFQGQTWNLLYQPKLVRLLRNEKQSYRLNSRPQMWPSGLILAMTLTLIFQGQICNLLFLSPKLSDCHKKNQKKHISWTLGLKCNHQVWPWQWPWSLNFKVRCDLDLSPYYMHGVDQGLSWSNFEIAVSQNGRANWHGTTGVG